MKIGIAGGESGVSEVACVLFSKIARQSYLRSHDTGVIGDEARDQLLVFAARAIEEHAHPLQDWRNTFEGGSSSESIFAQPSSGPSNGQCPPVPGSGLCRKSSNVELFVKNSGSNAVDTASSFVNACVDAVGCRSHASRSVELQIELLSAFVIGRDEASHHLEQFTKDPKVFRTLEKQCMESKMAASRALQQLSRAYPDVHRSVQTAAAARQVLYDQRRVMEEVGHEGVVEDAQRDKFVAQVEVALKRIIAHPPNTRPAEPAALLRETGWMAGMSDSVFQEVLQAAEHVTFDKGQVLLAKDATAQRFFVLKEGAVDSEMQVMTVGPGATVGLKSLLTQAPVRQVTPL
jgi:hypothetical protein